MQNEHGVLCSGRDAVCNQILMEATKIIKIMSAFDSWDRKPLVELVEDLIDYL